MRSRSKERWVNKEEGERKMRGVGESVEQEDEY